MSRFNSRFHNFNPSKESQLGLKFRTGGSIWLNSTVFSLLKDVSEQSGERIGEAGSAVHSEQEEAVYTAQEEF